jgi:hypothetical protein
MDMFQCLAVAAEIVVLSEAPPAAAFAAVLGGNQCLVNLIGDFTFSEQENERLHKLSNFLDPLAFNLGFWEDFSSERRRQ